MKYAQRLRHTARRPAAWLCQHHRRSGYRMVYQDTRRCQQNPLRWLCLWNRRQATVSARRTRWPPVLYYRHTATRRADLC